MRKATHILNGNSPASFDELQTLLRPVERGGGGWVPDPDIRPFSYGTAEIRIVHLAQLDGEGDGELVGTVSVGHGPEEQEPWYDKGYRVSRDHIYAKNVVMVLMKKSESKEISEPLQEPSICPHCGASVVIPEGIVAMECPNCYKMMMPRFSPEAQREIIKGSVPVGVQEHEVMLETMKREKEAEKESKSLET